MSIAGQFVCGSKKCAEREGLRSWEVNFAYVEQGEKKNALVKLRKLEWKSVFRVSLLSLSLSTDQGSLFSLKNVPNEHYPQVSQSDVSPLLCVCVCVCVCE